MSLLSSFLSFTSSTKPFVTCSVEILMHNAMVDIILECGPVSWGDGRAITLGGVLNSNSERWELQLKVAGKTPIQPVCWWSCSLA